MPGIHVGSDHPAARLDEMDVVLLRLLAREGRMPRGWMTEYARAKGVATATVFAAIGGYTWRCITHPAPVYSLQAGFWRFAKPKRTV